MKYKQGFTLMEILAVLLVIAVIASFAVPIVKSVRDEMRYQKAKAAAVQLAEAVRSYYTNTKGCPGWGSIDAADTDVDNCPANHAVNTGVPGQCGDQDGIIYVFGCGYISSKMFVDLPYRFVVSNPRESTSFVEGVEQVNGGDGRSFIVNRDMTITESDD